MRDGKQYPVSSVYLIPFSNIIGFVINFGTYFNKVELFMYCYLWEMVLD